MDFPSNSTYGQALKWKTIGSGHSQISLTVDLSPYSDLVFEYTVSQEDDSIGAVFLPITSGLDSWTYPYVRINDGSDYIDSYLEIRYTSGVLTVKAPAIFNQGGVVTVYAR